MSSRRSRRTHAQPRYNTDEYDPEPLDPQDQPTDTATDDNTNTANRNTNSNNNSFIQASQVVDQDSIEEVTRCICGSEDLKIPKNSHGEFNDIDTGFFIQCELCAVWQHGYCVGIFDEDNSPEKYWCEHCKPENHTLFIDKYGVKRSKYYPTIKIEKKSSKRKHKIINEVNNTNKISNNINNDNIHTNGNSNSAMETELNADGELESDGDDDDGDDDDDDDDDANKHRRKRVTLNSRDYQYELMLKKALEESAKESGVQPEDVNVSSPGEIPVVRETRSRKPRYGNEDSDQFELKEENENDDGDDDNNDEEGEISNENDNNDRNLETIKNKANNNNSTHNNISDNYNNKNNINGINNNNSNNRNNNNNNNNFNGNEESEVEKEKPSNNSDSSRSKHKNKKESSRAIRTKKSKGFEDNKNEDEDLDSESLSQSQTQPRSKSQVHSQNTTSNIKTNPRKTKVLKREKKENKDSKVTDDKPFRANIPSARINLNEMRRRIFSIMEFVSNIQIELSNEEEFKNSLLRLDTNSFSDDIKDSQHQLVSCYNDSVVKLDSLTKKLNDWENQYH